MPSGPIPDLDKDNASFLAYYQVTDKSGTFNPEQVQFETNSDARFQPQSTNVYDNGIEMKVDDTSTNNTITLRAGNENHNWVTAHLQDYTSDNNNGGEFTQNGTNITDVSEFTYTQNRSDLEGEYGLMPWFDYDTGYDSSQNCLFDIIEKVLSSTSFWTQSNLKLENSGIYNYSVSNDNQKTSIFGSHRGTETGSSRKTYGFSYTDNTNIHRAYLVGSCDNDHMEIDIYMNGNKAYRIHHEDTAYFANNITEKVKRDKHFEFEFHNKSYHYGVSFYVIVVWS